VQCSISFSLPYLQLVKNLIPLMPHPSLDTFFLWNSGSEAIEMAIKLVKKATGRPNLVTMVGSYHGRTHGVFA
jgi:4-aminobutyrate aminotransferase